MKRVITFLLVIICMFNFVGCKVKDDKKDEKKSEKKIGIEIKSVENTVNYYMEQLFKGNYKESKKLYTPEFAEKTENKVDNNLKIRGYKVIENTETGEAGYVKVRIAKMNVTKPSCVLDEDVFKVVKVNNEYKISEITSSVIGEIFMEKGNLRFKNRNEVKTSMLIYKDSLPKYAFAKDDSANLNKIPITKGEFSLANLSFSGDKVVISMKDDYTYIGIVTIDQTSATIGGAGSSNGGGQNGNGGNGGNGEALTPDVREKPIGKELTTLDVLKRSKIELMIFSNDEKFVLVQYGGEDGSKCIRIYSSDLGELIPFKFEENYNVNEVNILFDSFDKDAVNYEVIAKPGKGENQKDVVGKWQLDLKEFKVKKQ